MLNSFFIHPTALVESDSIGEGTRIWAFAHVLEGSVLGRDCNVGDHAFIEGGAVIGNNVTIKNQVCIWEGVKVEDDCFIGPHVVFTNDLHPRSPRMPEAKDRYESKENWLVETRVRRGSSIGANATILPGVQIGAYAMVAAGSVVTRDVRPHALVVGSPARQVGIVCRCGHNLADPLNLCCGQCGVELSELKIHSEA